ncbi:MAG: restriction endonuclease subunit S, partial [Nitrospirae bacterium]|nr:restriction endonuclease subunit S [Nitrospirota bacterium]
VGFEPFKEINQDYFYSVFLCMKPELLKEAPVNTQGNLNVERIGAMGMPLPPIEEQGDIVHYMEEKTVPLVAAISCIESEIIFLREYRTRLIADVVTGKLDVRDAAKKVPDEAAESGIIDEDEIQTGDEEIDDSAEVEREEI